MKDNKALKYLTLITGVSCHWMDPGNPSVCKWY